MDSSARVAPWLLIAFLQTGTACSAPPDPRDFPARAAPPESPDFPVRAAPPKALDFPARAAALETAGDPSSLVEAAVLRRALDQPELAAADTERFFARLVADPQAAAAAAEAYLDELADPALAPEPVAREAALRRFLALVSAPAATRALPAARVRAEVLLAAQLWEKSCPLPPGQRSDSACIERFALRGGYELLEQFKGKISHSRYLLSDDDIDLCYEPPPFRYVVHPRNPGPAREAQTLLAVALGRVLPAGARSAPLADALAQGHFLRAEPRFEAALARTAPLGLDFDPKSPRRMRSAKARFSAWLTARAAGPQLFPREIPLYEAPELGASAAWSLAAQARLAQLFIDLASQLFYSPQPIHRPPPPPGITKTDRLMSRGPFCCGKMYPVDAPWLDEAKKNLKGCTETAVRLTLSTPLARSCHEILSLINDDVFGRADEIIPLPSAQTALVDRCEPGATARSRNRNGSSEKESG